MFKSTPLAMCSILAGAAFLVAAGPTQETLKQTASVAQLEAAIGRQIKALDDYLAKEENFADNLTRDKIFSKAASIACLAQAILDHPDAKQAKSLAGSVRDAAQKLVDIDSHAEARGQLAEVKKAFAGNPLAYDTLPKPDWYDLATMENLMEELNFLHGDLRRTVRRSSDPEQDSLDAVVASVLALAVKGNPDYAEGDENKVLWTDLSEKLYAEYRGLGEAMRSKDTDAARLHHANAAKVCTACHDKFRKQ